MLHNIHVAYPNDNVWRKRIDKLEDIFKTELCVMDRCGSCYLKYYEAGNADDGFNVACDTPHAIVWYWHDYAWWPAKAYEYFEPGTFALNYEYFNVNKFGPDFNHMQP